MNILKAFDDEVRFLGLERRRHNFRKMIEHAVNFAREKGKCHIIETGVAWDTGNWRGQGQSTVIWDWLIWQAKKEDLNITATGIDITPKSIENARAQTRLVELIESDSVKALNQMGPEKLVECGLLYLDSYDWTPEKNIESAFHHVAELCAVWRYLPTGCLVAVDDRHGPEAGKHWMVEAFMNKYLGYEPVFKNHQIGWVK